MRTDRPLALVVFESMFGNTEKVAVAVADALRDHGYDARPGDVTTTSAQTALGVDLLVIGAPTHAFSLSRPGSRSDAVRRGGLTFRADTGMREWLARLLIATDGNLPACATFDTRVSKVRRLPGAAPKIAKAMREHGSHVVAVPQTFLVEDMAGPLMPGELDRARRWASELAKAHGSASSWSFRVTR